VGETSRDIRDVYETLSHGFAKQKDIYLFLRSLRIANAICFPNEDMLGVRTFEQVLSNAIDSDHRTVGCVGSGGERSGTAQIDFEADWQTGIVPLLKSAVVIISMPSVTDSCLEESYLIRNRKELLAKTLFVLPPLCCHLPDRRRLYKLKESFGNFQHRMVEAHREVIGLHFPEPVMNEGCFVMMNFKTGKVAKRRPWKIVRKKIRYIRRDRQPEVVEEKVHDIPSLDERDIRAAVNMVLHARGFI
jgi:hypothetical protein